MRVSSAYVIEGERLIHLSEHSGFVNTILGERLVFHLCASVTRIQQHLTCKHGVIIPQLGLARGERGGKDNKHV